MQISQQELKNYLVNRSHLVEKFDIIQQMLEFYSCIQVDPINVVARSHELALWNRVEGFKKQDLYDELYQNRSLYEYWLQLYSIIPLKYRTGLQIIGANKHPRKEKFAAAHQDQLQEILDYIAETGPTSSKGLKHIEGIKPYQSWKKTTSPSGLLNYLWEDGQLIVSHREGNNKFYDLTSRVLANSPQVDQDLLTEQESRDFIIESFFKYLGTLRLSFLTQRGSYPGRLKLRQRVGELIKAGEIIELEVPGIKTTYLVLKSQLPELERLKASNKHQQLNILSPLDPLVIDRQILEDIFGFYYRWEAYTPAKKRQYGFYNMPILFNGDFVGQIDLKKDTNASDNTELQTLGLFTELDSTEFKNSLDNYLEQLEDFAVSSD